MAVAAGRIIGINGDVLVLDTETQEVRAVQEGSEIYLNEVIITQEEATVAVETIDGNTITLGGDTQFVLSNDVVPLQGLESLPNELVGRFESLQRAQLLMGSSKVLTVHKSR